MSGFTEPTLEQLQESLKQSISYAESQKNRVSALVSKLTSMQGMISQLIEEAQTVVSERHPVANSVPVKTITPEQFELLNQCFNKHSFNELNSIDAGVIHNILSAFKSKITNTSVVFDVGANAGSFVKVLDQIYPGLKNTHCFEPHPVLASKTKSVYPHVRMNEFCLGNTNGEIDIHIPKHSVGLSSNIRRPVFDRLGQEIITLTVKSQTIDSYCQENNIDKIDFIKIDVEGAEKFVFEGATEMLRSKKILAGVFEVGDTLKDAGTSTEEVCALLESFGYKINKYFNHADYVFHL